MFDFEEVAFIALSKNFNGLKCAHLTSIMSSSPEPLFLALAKYFAFPLRTETAMILFCMSLLCLQVKHSFV